MAVMVIPIGVINSPFTNKTKTPIQVTRSPATGQVYVPDFDVRTDIKIGWYVHRSKE